MSVLSHYINFIYRSAPLPSGSSVWVYPAAGDNADSARCCYLLTFLMNTMSIKVKTSPKQKQTKLCSYVMMQTNDNIVKSRKEIVCQEESIKLIWLDLANSGKMTLIQNQFFPSINDYDIVLNSKIIRRRLDEAQAVVVAVPDESTAAKSWMWPHLNDSYHKNDIFLSFYYS